MPDDLHPALPPRPHSADEAGVQAWLEIVVLHFYRQLYRYALSLTGHESDAADLTQQTAVKFALKWQDIREDAAIKSWLYTTLYREFLLLPGMRELHLFTTPAAGLADAPAAGGAVEVHTLANRTLATWTRGAQTMLLFSHEPVADVRALLG